MIPNLIGCFVLKMTAGLAILGLVSAITIDNHLLTTKSDCYERLAIGQRLDSRDVFRTVSTATVADCQKECSLEGHKCLSLSFGIDPKGNGTCELSFITIKETADLRPIGTVRDPDYDLYIKKVDCKLNIPKDPPSSPSLPTDSLHSRPQHDHPHSSGPQYDNSALNNQKPIQFRPDELHRPTYLVAILDSHPNGRPQLDQPQSGSYGHVSQPQRPSAVSYGYNSGLDRPNSVSYGSHPDRPDSVPYRPQQERPNSVVYGPQPDKHNSVPYGPQHDSPYGSQPNRPNSIPYGPQPERPNYGSHQDRPNSSPYGPHQDRPNSIPYGPQHDRPNSIPYGPQPERPNFDPYGSPQDRPSSSYGLHSIPERPSSSYGLHSIPERPSSSYGLHSIPDRSHGPYGLKPTPIRPEAYDLQPGSETHYGPFGPRPDKVYDRKDQYNDPLVFHGDRRPSHRPSDGSYQNYYGVPRPLPHRPYDENKLSQEPGGQNYPVSEIFYDMPKPHPLDQNPDKHRPYYNDYYGDKRPESYRPYRPLHNSDNPNTYDRTRPSPDIPYRPEPDRPYDIDRRPPDRQNTIDYGSRPHYPERPEEEHRPYSDHRPYQPPILDDRKDMFNPYEKDNIRPFNTDRYRPHGPSIPETDWIRPYNDRKRPYGEMDYRPAADQNRPYGPEINRPYGPEMDRNKVYPPEIDRNRPYSSDMNRPYAPDRPHDSEIDRNRPYGLGSERPHSSDVDRNRPYIPAPEKHPSYHPEPDRKQPYNPEHRPPQNSNNPNSYDNQRPSSDSPYDKSHGLGLNQKRPDSNNPNYVDERTPLYERPHETDWDRSSQTNRPNYNSLNSSEQKPGDYPSKPDSTGGTTGYDKTTVQETSQGGKVTSIITLIVEPCYRRTLAGKRILRNFIKKAVPCERVEDCQRECQEEKRFVCEGFNYRLDPAGRGQGDCELTDLPISRMDPGRDIIPDRDYDFYEKDRDSGPDCRPLRGGGFRPGTGYPPSSGGHWPSGPPSGWAPHGPPSGPGYPPSAGGFPPSSGGYPPSGGGYPPSGGGYPPGGGRYPPSSGGYPPSSMGGHHPPSGMGSRGRPGDIYPLPPGGPPPRLSPGPGPSGPPGRYPPHDYGRMPSPGYHRPPYGDGRKDIGPPGPSGGGYYGHYYANVDRQDQHYGYGYHYPIEPHYPYSNRDDWRPSHDRPLLHYPESPNRRPEYRPGHKDQDAYYHDRERDRDYWGFNKYGNSGKWGYYGGTYGNFGGPESYYGDRRNQNRHDLDERVRPFVPYRIGQVGGPQDWGQYGGSYGTGAYSGGRHTDSYNYWGFDKNYPGHSHRPPSDSGSLVPHGGRPYLPVDDGHYGGSYGHHPGGSSHFSDIPYSHGGHGGYNNHVGGYDSGYHHHGDGGSSLFPPSDDDCSTRRGMGFRLHKAIVKKFYAVPNIHECEKLCFMEKDFPCVSFSYRYSITLSSPSDNCYLSDRPYKELDFYTDLEPDRDFDVYTMHKSQSCLIPVIEEESECFLRVRSGQRMDHSVVKDSMDVKSIVDCQLECLMSRRFTCRSFSYRYGPPLPGGSVDNCQLSDWPYAELNPRKDLIPEVGYEVYERGSYGHGCEEDHFTIPGLPGIGDGTGVHKHTDKICYVGYAKPARLTTEAAKGALTVPTELDCKAECTRAREETEFPCMSFSFRSHLSKEAPNCELSDIEQRDLLPDLDYRRDPDAWLFAWDNYNPQCLALSKPGGLIDGPKSPHGHGPYNALDTWRVYSVSGWPCRRGTTCQENREAGFWSCELEGGDVGSWDYCCRPDHRCGYSQGFGYPWCYVGPSRDQWRKCSDRYYPYINHRFPTDKHDTVIHTKPHFGPSSYEPYLPKPHASSRPSPPTWYSERPYRPPFGHHHEPRPPRPSLTEYEDKFHQQFLDPPKPGGFGPARHWPVSYLHKEAPPNATMDDDRHNRKQDKNYNAINSFMNTIKTDKDDKANKTEDDVFYVRLPMPDDDSGKMTQNDDDNDDDAKSEKILKFDVVDMKSSDTDKRKRDDFDDLFLISVPKLKNRTESNMESERTPKRDLQMFPIVRRGFVTRTNRTERKLRRRPEKDTIKFYNN